MQVSTSAFYAWDKQPEFTDKMRQEEALKLKVSQIFYDHKQAYGTRRLSDALKTAGFNVGRYKARRLRDELGLEVRYPKRFKVTTDSDHSEAISPNTLNRQFDVAEPNTVWATDITYVWSLEG